MVKPFSILILTFKLLLKIIHPCCGGGGATIFAMPLDCCLVDVCKVQSFTFIRPREQG